MPQMSPMWWTTLMIFTISTMYLSMNLTFFNFKNKNEMKKINQKKTLMWKW